MANKKRSKAGEYAWRRHQRQMLPWLPFVLAPAFAYPAFLLAFVVPGKVDVWVFGAVAVVFVGAMLAIEKKTNVLDKSWGEGARGEIRVGEELEKLHKDGFHVFHDWYSGRGNVDHFVVGPQGVFAIETKAWTGEISCKGGEILKDGRPPVGKNPIKQARGEAADVNKLIESSRGVNLWVSPVPCFSRAELRCYGRVEGVELVDIGGLRRLILEQPERYSPQRVNSISYALERHLDTAPAVSPGAPPSKPGRSKSALRFDRIFVALFVLFILVLTLAFPGSMVTLLERASGFYRFVEQVWSVLL